MFKLCNDSWGSLLFWQHRKWLLLIWDLLSSAKCKQIIYVRNWSKLSTFSFFPFRRNLSKNRKSPNLVLLSLWSVIWFPIKVSTRWNISHKFPDIFFAGGESPTFKYHCWSMEPQEVLASEISIRFNQTGRKCKETFCFLCELLRMETGIFPCTRHWIWICAQTTFRLISKPIFNDIWPKLGLRLQKENTGCLFVFYTGPP